MSCQSPSSSDEFHDSLERILSSSCSSTSASDDDAVPRRRPLPSPASFEVWIAEPAPVEERRRRLLHQLGLAVDPALSFRRRSVSCDGLYDTSVARSDELPPPILPHPHPPGLPRSRPPVVVAAAASSSNDDAQRCTIRNLDTGGEFVVAEDGERSELLEVGTGRQLTMEEFEMCAGRSPIVQELMRRQTDRESGDGGVGGTLVRSKKRGGWLRSIKNTVAGSGYHQRTRSFDERDTLSERRSSTVTEDHGAHWTKVRQYSKSKKELNCLYMIQETQAHSGAIWCIKFSLNGEFLASAGEDCVIHVWRVTEQERKDVVEENDNCSPFVGSPETVGALTCVQANHWEKKRRAKLAGGRKSAGLDQVSMPEQVFALSDKPVCTFRGHLNDVLDLSWSKSQCLLSSSMDKTVKLWHMSRKSCVKTFSHSDYVTCIQFNPVDDRFFISGSLDEKVRIWNIPDRQIVDWNDLHEMITAACYTPDGQGALVGSHKGSCHLFHTSENKLHQKSQIDLQNKKRKSSSKKITGFQFAPGSSSEVLVTSADSRIRVIDGAKLVHKFKGFRNTSSQMTACLTSNGKFVICASEDSYVHVWRYDTESRHARSNGAVTSAQSHEHFHCQDVTVAVPWSASSGMERMLPGSQNIEQGRQNGIPKSNSDRISATWPEEKLVVANKCSPHGNDVLSSNSNGGIPLQSRSAWGMVIVTAGRGGKISIFQNFGMPPTG